MGETFTNVDSFGGAAGSIAKSFLNPADAITDLTSAVGILGRGVMNGDLSLTTFMEAGQYAFSAIPGLGALADFQKFKGIFADGMKIGGEINDLNKGLDTALSTAKAAKAGDVADLSKIGNNIGDLNKLEQWENLKDLKVKVMKDGQSSTISMDEAFTLYKKDPSTSGLKESLENTVNNYNAGAKNPDLFNDIDTKELMEQRELASSWETTKTRTD